MLPKSLRVKKQDFPVLIKEGLVFYGLNLQLRLFWPKGSNKTRFSVVVSAKAVRSSVQRHKYKRLIRALVEGLFPRLVLGADFVIFIQKNLNKKTKDEITEEAINLIKKAKLLN